MRNLERKYLRILFEGLRTRDPSLPFERLARGWWLLRNGPDRNRARREAGWLVPRRIRARDLTTFRLEFASLGAAAEMMSEADRHLAVAPLVPAEALREELCETGISGLESLRRLLLAFWRIGAITLEEESALFAAGRLGRMPEGWSLADGPYARLEAAGVQVQDRVNRSWATRADALQATPWPCFDALRGGGVQG